MKCKICINLLQKENNNIGCSVNYKINKNNAPSENCMLFFQKRNCKKCKGYIIVNNKRQCERVDTMVMIPHNNCRMFEKISEEENKMENKVVLNSIQKRLESI